MKAFLLGYVLYGRTYCLTKVTDLAHVFVFVFFLSRSILRHSFSVRDVLNENETSMMNLEISKSNNNLPKGLVGSIYMHVLAKGACLVRGMQ